MARLDEKNSISVARWLLPECYFYLKSGEMSKGFRKMSKSITLFRTKWEYENIGKGS